MVLRLLLAVALAAATVRAAGDADGRNSGPEAQILRLNPGEKLRHGPAPGKGLTDNYLVADVVVAGGGSSGCSAALASARNGAKTVLIHGPPVLGGNAGADVRLSQVGACGSRANDNNALIMECREGGIVEEYTLDNVVGNPFRVPELFSLELYNKMVTEPNIILLRNTWLVAVTMDGNRIVSAIAEDQISQNRYTINATVFIDTTGDGRLGAEAGAEFITGREGPQQYNESIAQGPDTETEGTSLAFIAADMGSPQPYTPPPWAEKFNASTFKYRNVNSFQYGFWWNEVSWPYQTISDNNKIIDQLYANLFGIWDYIKNSGNVPNSQNWTLTWFETVACKREGRRFIGQYVMTQNDIMTNPQASPPQAPEMYWDRVSFGGWPFDLHNPKGMFDPSNPPYASYRLPYMYSTPLRSLLAKNISNLMFAGRLASFSHVVFGSQRVMKTGSTMGQAAGTAAAFAVKHGIAPADLPSNPDNVWSIQQQLLRDDAFIIGMLNADPRDYARTARAFATSERVTSSVNGSAANVLTGQTRAAVTPLTSYEENGGVAPGQGVPGSNRWISQGLPASVTLALASAAPISQVHLVFDTGMHRKLSFSVVTGGVGIWGPQPETVRDYTIEGRTPQGQFQLLCNVTNNFQRRRVHNVPCNPMNPPQSWPPLVPSPPPPAPPGPAPPPVAGQAVSMVTCDPTDATQRWMLAANGEIAAVGQPSLCLAYDGNHPAAGGHGQAVTLLPCAQSPNWQFSASTANGSSLRLPSAVPCVNYTGDCQCAKGVRTSSGSGAGTLNSGASVELWSCAETLPEAQWQQLRFADYNGSSLLSAGGLCLASRSPAAPALTQRDGTCGGAPLHGAIYPAAAPPVYDQIRINVTATNGIADAHILEVRLYDDAGKAPFPTRSSGREKSDRTNKWVVEN